MATGNQLNIIILSQETPRAAALSALITDGMGENAKVILHNISETESLEAIKYADLCIVDLMSSDNTIQATLSNIKSSLPDSKIIALHIYTSHELIRPIIDRGVDGYLNYNPQRKELVEAIRNVAAGKQHFPDHLEIG